VKAYHDQAACPSTAAALPPSVLRPPILMEVTRSPQFFKSTPILLAVTPFPSPLTTPPVTSTYFIFAALFKVRASSNHACKKQDIVEILF
jgi:hypothetical protein